MVTIAPDEPLAVAAIQAIRTGDPATLWRLLSGHPELAAARVGSDQDGETARTLLHVATDWPGHLPNGPASVAAANLWQGAALGLLDRVKRRLDAALRSDAHELADRLRSRGARSARDGT